MRSPEIINSLTALDRCDACGAQAKVIVTMSSGLKLLFCAHHGRENREALIAQGADFADPQQALAV